MSNKYFVHEYENNKDDKIVEITLDEFLNFLLTFDREQVSVNPDTRLDYAKINDISSIKTLFDSNNVMRCIHQDSERDLFIIS